MERRSKYEVAMADQGTGSRWEVGAQGSGSKVRSEDARICWSPSKTVRESGYGGRVRVRG